jgi:hypothetical protein
MAGQGIDVKPVAPAGNCKLDIVNCKFAIKELMQLLSESEKLGEFPTKIATKFSTMFESKVAVQGLTGRFSDDASGKLFLALSSFE